MGCDIRYTNVMLGSPFNNGLTQKQYTSGVIQKLNLVCIASSMCKSLLMNPLLLFLSCIADLCWEIFYTAAMGSFYNPPVLLPISLCVYFLLPIHITTLHLPCAPFISLDLFIHMYGVEWALDIDNGDQREGCFCIDVSCLDDRKRREYWIIVIYHLALLIPCHVGCTGQLVTQAPAFFLSTRHGWMLKTALVYYCYTHLVFMLASLSVFISLSCLCVANFF